MNPVYELPRSDIVISGTMNIGVVNQFNLEVPLGFSRPMKSGVYEIINKVNGRRYIGMSRILIQRRDQHWNKLLNSSHKSSDMMNDLDLFVSSILQQCNSNDLSEEEYLDLMKELFEFRVIMFCHPSELTFYENKIINAIKPYYNQKKVK